MDTNHNNVFTNSMDFIYRLYKGINTIILILIIILITIIIRESIVRVTKL